MGRTRRSARYRSGRLYDFAQSNRKEAKRRRKSHKMEREKVRRSAKMEELYGYEGRSKCGRKIRYANSHAAQIYVDRHPTVPNLTYYRCPFCNGWHLTSHPLPTGHVEGGEDQLVREVFELARDAALEIRRSEEELLLKVEAIGPQGYSLGPHSKNGILDPMRKVDELMDAQAEAHDMSGLRALIDDGFDIVAGAEKILHPTDVQILTRYWLQAESWRDIARDLEGCEKALQGKARTEQVEMLRGVSDVAIDRLERIGVAHLKEMGR